MQQGDRKVLVNLAQPLISPSSPHLPPRYLTQEFMSTRIGIRREGKILSAVKRTGADGLDYYDLTIRRTSYSSSNPYRGGGAWG